jgi:tRNA dimethylallyltransferase
LKPLLVILGPTASGKTKLAVEVCKLIGGELISVDSRQIYRDMNIGTGKDLQEYTLGGVQIPYHLIDIRNAGEQYNVNDFHKDFSAAYASIDRREAVAVACGGTGFYLHSVLTGSSFNSVPVNKELRTSLINLSREELSAKFTSYNTIYTDLADTSTHKRLIRAIEISDYLTRNSDKAEQWKKAKEKPQAVIYGLKPDVTIRRERITARLQQRLNEGMVEEVQDLLNRGLSADQLIYYGLEYKYITLYLTGQMTYNDMILRLETEIHRFAKRQMTFFRKMEKDGLQINWLDLTEEGGKPAQFIVKHYEAINAL